MLAAKRLVLLLVVSSETDALSLARLLRPCNRIARRASSTFARPLQPAAALSASPLKDSGDAQEESKLPSGVLDVLGSSDGMSTYVCSTTSFHYDDWTSCELDVEMSRFYGVEVAVCRRQIRSHSDYSA
jgi:hypothetical protein